MKVAVALSGGVDSAVAAWLQKRDGHDLTALSLRLGWGPDEAPRAGRALAERLGIPHRVVDARDAFTRLVVEPTVDSYRRGNTPNPCAYCNAGVKFALLWEVAASLGCERLVTGHYARLAGEGRGLLLQEGVDGSKSQAYFLARLDPELFGRLHFPLGGHTKAQVREIAREAGLAGLVRSESQDVCFLPSGGWDELMTRFDAVRPGPVEDLEGRVVGSHQGLHRYTVGQRRGLGLAMGRPVYVVSMDGERAAVRIGPRDELACRGLVGTDLLWYEKPQPGQRLTVRFRYRHRPAGCRVEEDGEGVLVHFDQPQGAVAPGQMAVFFRDDLVLGSAFIAAALPAGCISIPGSAACDGGGVKMPNTGWKGGNGAPSSKAIVTEQVVNK